MNREKYNVLWLDDKHDSQLAFTKEAEANGINLRGFRTLDDGFDSLENSIRFYDAILLDTTFFMDRDDENRNKISKSITALSHAVDRINQLSSEKLFPYFIFTSNDQYDSDPTFVQTYGAAYHKNSEGDMQRLFADIRNRVQKEIDAIIRNKYSDVFDAFDSKYIGPAHQKTIFDLLKNYENQYALDNADLYFNPLRKLLEAIFVMFYKYGVLTNSCFKGPGEPNITYCSIYLSGKELRLNGGRYAKAKEKVFPNIIQNNVWNIINYTNMGSHNEAVNKDVGGDIRELRSAGVNSPYLLFVLTFEMLDVILWSKAYIDTHFVRNKKHIGRGKR